MLELFIVVFDYVLFVPRLPPQVHDCPRLGGPSHSGLLDILKPTLVIPVSRSFALAVPSSCKHAFEN